MGHKVLPDSSVTSLYNCKIALLYIHFKMLVVTLSFEKRHIKGDSSKSMTTLNSHLFTSTNESANVPSQLLEVNAYGLSSSLSLSVPDVEKEPHFVC